MLRSEAEAVVAQLSLAWSSPRADPYERRAQEDVERFWVESCGVEDYCVVLLWKQGTNRYGVRVSRLSPITGDPTPEMVALDLRMLFVEEPQGEVGEPDADGRYWLDEDQEYLGRTHQR